MSERTFRSGGFKKHSPSLCPQKVASNGDNCHDNKPSFVGGPPCLKQIFTLILSRKTFQGKPDQQPGNQENKCVLKESFDWSGHGWRDRWLKDHDNLFSGVGKITVGLNFLAFSNFMEA
jgi:hypothetical protein